MQTTVVATLAAGVFGAGLGGGLRAVLARMRRGARAPAGACELAVAAAVAVPVLAGTAGAVPPLLVPVWVGLGILAVAVSVTDLAHRRIPNAVTGPALPALVALTVPLGTRAVLAGIVGAVLAVLLHAAVHLVAPGALGAGDVKLAGVLGVPLAAGSWWALAAAPVLGAVLVLVTATATRRRTVALGPLLAGAAWLLLAATAVTSGPGPP